MKWLFVFSTQLSEGIWCVAEIYCDPGRVCVKPAGCRARWQGTSIALGSGTSSLTDLPDVAFNLKPPATESPYPAAAVSSRM